MRLHFNDFLTARLGLDKPGVRKDAIAEVHRQCGERLVNVALAPTHDFCPEGRAVVLKAKRQVAADLDDAIDGALLFLDRFVRFTRKVVPCLQATE